MAMKSYLILTSPGKGANDEQARFIRDGFSWTRFLFPEIWLLGKRLWLAAAVIAVLRLVAFGLSGEATFWPAGLALLLATGLIVSLEGPSLLVRRLLARGWSEQELVTADALETAELMHYGVQTAGEADDVEKGRPVLSGSAHAAASAHASALGLLGSYGER